jgi:hypothetical protein
MTTSINALGGETLCEALDPPTRIATIGDYVEKLAVKVFLIEIINVTEGNGAIVEDPITCA